MQMYRYLLSVVLLISLTPLMGCGGGSGGSLPEEGTVNINIQFPPETTRGTPTVDEVWCRITAADMNALVRQLAYNPTTKVANGTLTVPAGRNRTFYVWAEEANNDVIYEDTTTSDVPAGETTTINLQLNRTTGEVVIHGTVVNNW